MRVVLPMVMHVVIKWPTEAAIKRGYDAEKVRRILSLSLSVRMPLI